MCCAYLCPFSSRSDWSQSEREANFFFCNFILNLYASASAIDEAGGRILIGLSALFL